MTTKLPKKKEKMVVGELWGPLATLDGKNNLYFILRCAHEDPAYSISTFPHGLVKESELD